MARIAVGPVLARSLRAHALAEPAASVSEAITAAAGIYGTAPTSHPGLTVRLLDDVPGMRGSVFLARTRSEHHCVTGAESHRSPVRWDRTNRVGLARERE